MYRKSKKPLNTLTTISYIDKMIDRYTSFYKRIISGDIDVTVCHDDIVLVDGQEVFNVFDMTKSINERLLREIDTLNSE